VANQKYEMDIFIGRAVSSCMDNEGNHVVAFSGMA
jgi:hypothetical protein